jgi:hypothetical protein
MAKRPRAAGEQAADNRGTRPRRRERRIARLEERLREALKQRERRRREFEAATACTRQLVEKLARQLGASAAELRVQTLPAVLAKPPEPHEPSVPHDPSVPHEPSKWCEPSGSSVGQDEDANFLRFVASEAADAIRTSSHADHLAHTRVGARRASAARRDARRSAGRGS